jgi:hypothetical protein
MLNNQITKRFLATKFAEDVEHKFMKLKRKWRKIVTGDEEKKVRVHLKETQKTPDFIKLFDKISFTVGVLNIVSCQYFLLNLPGNPSNIYLIKYTNLMLFNFEILNLYFDRMVLDVVQLCHAYHFIRQILSFQKFTLGIFSNRFLLFWNNMHFY